MMTTQQMAALIEGYVEYGSKRIVSAEARFLFYPFWLRQCKVKVKIYAKQKSGLIRPLYFCVKRKPCVSAAPGLWGAYFRRAD